MFVSRTRQTIPVPYPDAADPAATVTIQKLTGLQLQEAEEVMTKRVRAELSDPAAREALAEGIQSALAQLKDLPDEVRQRIQPDPLGTYDNFTVLRHGLVGWSYRDEAGAPLAVTDDRIREIDAENAPALTKAILQLTKPGLFQTVEEQEASRKNG